MNTLKRFMEGLLSGFLIGIKGIIGGVLIFLAISVLVCAIWLAIVVAIFMLGCACGFLSVWFV